MTSTGEQQQDQARTSGQWSGRNTAAAFGTIGALTIGAMVWMASYDPAPEPVDPLVEQVDAQRVCHEYVGDRLKAPATASFDSTVTAGAGRTYTVVGTVDAENSFGALVRESFTCTVRGDGMTWHLQALDVG